MQKTDTRYRWRNYRKGKNLHSIVTLNGADIKYLLDKKGFYLSDVARELGVSVTLIHHIIYGKASSCRITKNIEHFLEFLPGTLKIMRFTNAPDNLKYLLKKKGYSLIEIAREVGVSRQCVDRAIRGHGASPKVIPHIEKILGFAPGSIKINKVTNRKMKS